MKDTDIGPNRLLDNYLVYSSTEVIAFYHYLLASYI